MTQSRRLEQLYEISQLFASFETVEQTFYPVLEIARRTLALRSAILVEAEATGSKTIVWPAEDRDSEHMREITGALERGERQFSNRFVVIPLVVAQRPPLGALQLEGLEPLDPTALIFVTAIANQLAIALDRDRAWRRDITRREHAEVGRTDAEGLAIANARLYAEAQQAVRVREQLLAIVSHDLRNPLAAILMGTELLAEDGAMPQVVGRIQRAAKRMQGLIEDLLDFASIEAGRLAIRRKPQDPGAIVHETLASFEGVAHAKGVQLTIDIAPDLPAVFCDGDRILQVLSNLVGNATKAVADGGRIALRVAPHGPEVVFAVSDDGPGISPPDLEHLFERYWRSDEADYKGTGLGLAIARGIVGAHGGRIWAESDLGHGATFQFTLPTADLTLLFAVPVFDEGSVTKS